MKNSLLFLMLLSLSLHAEEPTKSAPLDHFLRRIQAKSADPKSGGSIVIVAFGDSITMGATSRGTIEPEAVYHARLKKLLEEKYPKAVFSVINSGIGGDNAEAGLARIDRDVIRYQPDLVLVAFGANGLGESPARLSAYESFLHKIVAKIRGGTEADVMLLTTPFMATRDNGIPSASQKQQLTELMKLQNTGVVKRFAETAKQVASAEGVAWANVYGAWEKQAAGGVDTTALLANGLNHPTGAAQEIGAREVFAVIETAAKATTAPVSSVTK